jgi:hypothetical protein
MPRYGTYYIVDTENPSVEHKFETSKNSKGFKIVETSRIINSLDSTGSIHTSTFKPENAQIIDLTQTAVFGISLFTVNNKVAFACCPVDEWFFKSLDYFGDVEYCGQADIVSPARYYRNFRHVGISESCILSGSTAVEDNTLYLFGKYALSSNGAYILDTGVFLDDNKTTPDYDVFSILDFICHILKCFPEVKNFNELNIIDGEYNYFYIQFDKSLKRFITKYIMLKDL